MQALGQCLFIQKDSFVKGVVYLDDVLRVCWFVESAESTCRLQVFISPAHGCSFLQQRTGPRKCPDLVVQMRCLLNNRGQSVLTGKGTETDEKFGITEIVMVVKIMRHGDLIYFGAICLILKVTVERYRQEMQGARWMQQKGPWLVPSVGL